jgi:hypothetical protein
MLASTMRALWLVLLLAGCGRPAPEPAGPTSWDLLSPAHAAGWRSAGIPEQGEALVREGEIHLAAGLPMTGIAFAGWETAGLPGTGYAVEYEAMRVEGEDIFGMLTFPVASHDAHATFVLGGWGGTVTGISSIDFADASENSTRGEQRFENDRWYRVRLEVRPDDLRAWVEGRPVVNVSIKGRQVSLRPGYIDHCLPFGFATWNTVARIRSVRVERL